MGYRNNNQYNKSSNVIINQRVPKEMSKYFCSKSILSRDINKDSLDCNLNALFIFLNKEKSCQN